MTLEPPDLPEPVAAEPADERVSLPSDGSIAAELRGFGPLGIVAILGILLGNAVFVPFSGILVLLWVWRSRTPWSAIAYVRPRSWARTVIIGIVFGVAFKLLMKSIVMPLLGADPINHAYHYLAGNRAALPGAIYLMIAGAGFGEETVYRGFLFERFGRILGSSTWARVLIVLITSAWFGIAHYPEQGLAGAEQAVLTGLVFGTIVMTTRSIFLPMVVHAAFDLTAVWIIYGNLETRIAHLVFR